MAIDVKKLAKSLGGAVGGGSVLCGGAACGSMGASVTNVLAGGAAGGALAFGTWLGAKLYDKTVGKATDYFFGLQEVDEGDQKDAETLLREGTLFGHPEENYLKDLYAEDLKKSINSATKMEEYFGTPITWDSLQSLYKRYSYRSGTWVHKRGLSNPDEIAILNQISSRGPIGKKKQFIDAAITSRLKRVKNPTGPNASPVALNDAEKKWLETAGQKNAKGKWRRRFGNLGLAATSGVAVCLIASVTPASPVAGFILAYPFVKRGAKAVGRAFTIGNGFKKQATR